jgi:dihydroorotate dehydrogenase electron transfer subunit
MIQQICEVRSCKKVAEKTYLLQFDSDKISHMIRPGQFVDIQVASINDGPLLRRPFSVARTKGNTIEILFHVIGPGTKLLSQKKTGDQIDIIGPLGQPFHADADYGTAIIVAGGIGVAPFPFLTANLRKLDKHIETFIGFRQADMVFKSHLQNVHVATDDGSEGFKGNVVQLLESSIDKISFGKAKIFACGPTVMLKALTEFAKKKNICCELSLEGQMACGIGICQGCAVERTSGEPKYSLVCKDGPTFLSTEVNL